MEEILKEVDFEDFGGVLEIGQAIELLRAWKARQFSPIAWEKFDVIRKPKVCFNTSSGKVFLADDDYQVCVSIDGRLRYFVMCGACGAEGIERNFVVKMNHDCEECRAIYAEICNIGGAGA